jgi:DNA-binding MltR family transcriptional regulator
MKDQESLSIQQMLMKKIGEMRRQVFRDSGQLKKRDELENDSGDESDPSDKDVLTVIRELEKVEWALIEWNKGVKKLDPLQNCYL